MCAPILLSSLTLKSLDNYFLTHQYIRKTFLWSTFTSPKSTNVGVPLPLSLREKQKGDLTWHLQRCRWTSEEFEHSNYRGALPLTNRNCNPLGSKLTIFCVFERQVNSWPSQQRMHQVKCNIDNPGGHAP
ncbi:hypothetical protein CDAR_289921 [Caerostris darwini]|uniref:Uncharacterized protein n=1 Tax=Caerostris darwini TaxID=1538125 RepID=A0AAV4WVK2_9ARAC|nr:hypothetical protein CDAR_289921 [Caerostris darwini]